MKIKQKIEEVIEKTDQNSAPKLSLSDLLLDLEKIIKENREIMAVMRLKTNVITKEEFVDYTNKSFKNIEKIQGIIKNIKLECQ